MNPYKFAETHQPAFLEELMAWLRIPSISTLPQHQADLRRAATWLKTQFEAIGMSRVELFETPDHPPLVYAEWLEAGEDAPTVLVYGHYDVQPADDGNQQWLSDPFIPEIRDEKLYARGATDDKGQTLTQIKAVQSLIATGQLPVNVKFIIEGEEENGSEYIHHFVAAQAELLQADVAVVSDTHMLGLDCPSIVTGLRGITYLEIEVRGPTHDLHSGAYGGLVHNPAQALVQILAAMHDAAGRIIVPGFYDNVSVVSDEERAELAKAPYELAQLEHETGVSKAWGEPGYAPHERLGIRPTLEINGLVSGWIEEGSKTVLPAKALAKVSCRLVPDQIPHRIAALIRDYVAALTPDTVTSEVRKLHDGMWAVVDLDSVYLHAAVQAYEFGFGVSPVFTREGGSIPVVATFQDELNVPVILMGFGLPDDNLHGPNENFKLASFYQGMKTAIKFYEELGTAHV